MKISLITTISGQYRIVDAGDNEEGSPLIVFSNQFNKKEIAEEVFKFLISEAERVEEIKKIEKSSYNRFENMDLD